MKFSTVLTATVGITGGNFIYQAFADAPQWVTAAERSYFGFVALFTVWAAQKLRVLS